MKDKFKRIDAGDLFIKEDGDKVRISDFIRDLEDDSITISTIGNRRYMELTWDDLGQSRKIYYFDENGDGRLLTKESDPIFVDVDGYKLDLTVNTGLQSDVVRFGDGDDSFTSLGGNDKAFGRDGNDVLYGSKGRDFLSGGDGIDAIVGGGGRDTLSGGADADTFEFSKTQGADATITDFEIKKDVVLVLGYDKSDATLKITGKGTVLEVGKIEIFFEDVEIRNLNKTDILFLGEA